MNLETMAGQLLVELEACGFSQPDRMAVWGCVVSLWEAEIERLTRIEAAARDAVDSGQAQYEAEEQYAGDLVPAAKMMSLAEAVHGAQIVEAKPPPASDEYARELDLALFAPAAAQDVAVDLDDDGCPVGDPDCDLPADSLHEFCEAALDGKASPQ